MATVSDSTQMGFRDITGIFRGCGSRSRQVRPDEQQKCAEILFQRNSLSDRGLEEVIAQLGTINKDHANCWLKSWSCQVPEYEVNTLSLHLTYRLFNGGFQDGLFVPLITIMTDEISRKISLVETYRTFFGWGKEAVRFKDLCLNDLLYHESSNAGEVSIDSIEHFLRGKEPKLTQIMTRLVSRFNYPLGLLKVEEDFCLSWNFASGGEQTHKRPAYILCAIVATKKTESMGG